MVDTNASPFYDDFDPSKGFHKVLFRPGRSVQVREMNQLQSIIEEQINRIGSHFFKSGSVVGEGSVSVREDQDTLRVLFPTDFQSNFLSQSNDFYLRGANSGLRAKILKYLDISGNTGWFAIEYLNTDGETKTEYALEESLIVSQLIDGTEVDITTAVIAEKSKGFYAGIIEGVYFVNGSFVLSPAQSILIPEPSPSKLVGFRIHEEIIDETMDASLFSNASGEPNYKGAGACRLKLSLSLEAIDRSAKDDTFIEIVEIQEGDVLNVNDTTQYAAFNDILAQRTYEESGNYTVTHPPVEILDHIRDESHVDGLYTPVEGGNESLMVMRLKRGVSYVQGYRHEISNYKDVVVEKARDTKIINNGVVQSQYGSYIVTSVIKGLPKLDLTRTHNLVDDANTILGTCKVRAAKRDGENLVLYLMDIKMNANQAFSNVKRIVASFSTLDTFEASLVVSSVFGGTVDSLLFPLPYANVSSLTGTGGLDVTFNVTRSFDIVLDATGKSSIGLTGSEIFNSINSLDYLVCQNGSGTLPVTGLALGGSPTGKVLNVDYGNSYAGVALRVIATIIKTNPTYKTKTLRETTENLSLNDASSVSLSKADIYRIVSVINTDSGLDMTSGFTFFDGQRPNWYETGSLISTSGTVTANITVTYEYFEHSNSGEFFCVDSYNVPRTDIPTSKESSDRVLRSLADCIDFRLLKTSNGSFTNLPTAYDIVNPNDNVRIDLTMFLPRIDILYVSAAGNYSVAKGTSSETPVAPKIPADSMALYQLNIPAYTDTILSVKASVVENRRYTMADIGKIDQRLKNVEYYATLSQVETKAERTQILDPDTGNNRYKNGIAADRFKDFRLIDILDQEWAASIDTEEGIVSAPIVQNGIDLSYLSGGVKHGSTVTLPYDLVEFASQVYATTTSNINPFAVFTWGGTVTLNPMQDFWKDTVYNKPIVLNETNDLTNGLKAGDELLSSVVSETTRLTQRLGETIQTTTDTFVNTKIQESTSVKVTDSRVSIQVLPYMRGIDISFDLKGFKPLTRLYPFFSGIAVSSQCRQTGKDFGEAIVTDANGSATGTFRIPTTTDFRFKNGTNILKFTDSQTNSDDPNNNFTMGEAAFVSGGELETRQKTTTVTKTLRAIQTKWTSSSSRVTARWNRDPVAQTFSISKDGGGFIKAVDIYFSTKARSIPVTLQIRNVYNGTPSNEVLMFGEVIKNPDQVNVSNNGTVATRFEFSDPVYLEKDKEYAIVLLADTQEYNVFLARMGEIDLANNYVVAKQPHTGVFFVSSNGQTWTPNQLEDLKFKIMGCKFKTDTAYTAVLEGSSPSARLLPYNSISTTEASSSLKVECLGHGLKVGDYVSITGAVSGNGIDASRINQEQRVVTADVDWFTIDATTPALVSGSIGGGAIMVACNNPFDKVCPWLGTFVLDSTSLSLDLLTHQQGNRTAATFTGLLPDTLADMPFDGISTKDLKPKLSITMKSDNEWVTPMIDLDGAGLELIGSRISTNATDVIAKVITRSMKFNNPSTSARIYLVGNIPYGSSVKLKYKDLTSGDENLTNKEWKDVSVVKNFKNSNSDSYEAEYEINTQDTFLGLKLRIELFASEGNQAPELSELRLIALA
ncbi:structural protein [Acinetobacter phage SH-Ab 15599]|nr:structural protein [Acinetobacter phage SH-Ab 15599]